MKLRNNLTDNCEFVQTNDSAGLAMPANLTLATITLISSWTLGPAPANSRYVPTPLNLGNIGNPKSVLIAFYLNAAPDAEIPKGLQQLQQILPNPSALTVSNDVPTNLSNSIILVSEDYSKTKRFSFSDKINEKYGASNTVLPFGRSYADIGVGVLFGWYAYGGGTTATGIFNMGFLKLQTESFWLTQSGVNTYLNAAFFNNDTTNAGLSITVKVALVR